MRGSLSLSLVFFLTFISGNGFSQGLTSEPSEACASLGNLLENNYLAGIKTEWSAHIHRIGITDTAEWDSEKKTSQAYLNQRFPPPSAIYNLINLDFHKVNQDCDEKDPQKCDRKFREDYSKFLDSYKENFERGQPTMGEALKIRQTIRKMISPVRDDFTKRFGNDPTLEVGWHEASKYIFRHHPDFVEPDPDCMPFDLPSGFDSMFSPVPGVRSLEERINFKNDLESKRGYLDICRKRIQEKLIQDKKLVQEINLSERYSNNLAEQKIRDYLSAYVDYYGERSQQIDCLLSRYDAISDCLVGRNPVAQKKKEALILAERNIDGLDLWENMLKNLKDIDQIPSSLINVWPAVGSCFKDRLREFGVPSKPTVEPPPHVSGIR